MSLDDLAGREQQNGVKPKPKVLTLKSAVDTVGQDLIEKLKSSSQEIPAFARDIGIVDTNLLRPLSSIYSATYYLYVRSFINRKRISVWLIARGIKDTSIYEDANGVFCADVATGNGRVHLEFYQAYS